MEKNPENPLNALKGLKQQYQSFNQALEGQKIISDDEVGYTIKHCRDFFRSHRKAVIIDYLISIAILLAVLALYHVSAIFSVCTAMILLVGMFTELWIVRDLDRQCQNDSLLKFSQHLFDAKRFLLIYYIVLACSLLIISAMATAMADLPWIHLRLQYFLLTTVGMEIVFLFLAHYLPLRNQCNEALGTISTANGNSKKSTRWIKFVGLVVLSFVVLTAVFKLNNLPGGTLFMLDTAVLIIAYSVALAVWLHYHRSLPILLGLLMVWTVSVMTYMVMARINCWPPLRHLDKNHVEFLKREPNDSAAAGRFAIHQLYFIECDEFAEASSDLVSALSTMNIDLLDADPPALLAVAVGDTALVNTFIHGSNAPLGAGDQFQFAWSMPVADGRCQLYLLYKNPIVGSLNQKPLLDGVSVEYKEQTPLHLDLYLTQEAAIEWQANLMKLDDKSAPVLFSAVYDGKVLCIGTFDHKKIGYQSIRFSLESNTTIPQSLLQELVNN